MSLAFKSWVMDEREKREAEFVAWYLVEHSNATEEELSDAWHDANETREQSDAAN